MIGNIGDQIVKAMEKATKPYTEQTAEMLDVLRDLNDNIVKLTEAIQAPPPYVLIDGIN
jgi:hypothetical protein